MEEQNSSKQIKSGMILSYVFVFISFAVNFIYTPILTRSLGQNNYGTYSLVISIVSYLEILNSGMASTYIKFAAKQINDESKLANINGIIFTIYILFACIAIIGGIILIAFLHNIFPNFSNMEIQEMRVMLTIMLFNIAIVAISGLFESYIVLKERFVFQKGILIVKKLLVPIITIPLLIIGYRSTMVVLITTLINFFMLTMNMYYCKKKLKIRIRINKIEKKMLKEIIIFYVFMLLTVIIDQINWSIDSIIIGMKRNSEDVATYTIASQINAIYITLSTTVASIFVPRIHFIVNQEKEDKVKNKQLLELITKTGRIQCMTIFLILLGFVFFGKQFIILLFGKEYELAYFATLLLIIPITFSTIKGNLLEVYRAKDKQKMRTIIYLIIAIINVVISYFACEKYGIIGSTFGTTISIIIGHIIIINIYDYKVIKIDMIKFWKDMAKMIPAFIIPIIAGILICYKVNLENIHAYITSIVIFSLIYLANIYFFALSKDEKKKIKSRFSNS